MLSLSATVAATGATTKRHLTPTQHHQSHNLKSLNLTRSSGAIKCCSVSGGGSAAKYKNGNGNVLDVDEKKGDEMMMKLKIDEKKGDEMMMKLKIDEKKGDEMMMKLKIDEKKGDEMMMKLKIDEKKGDEMMMKLKIDETNGGEMMKLKIAIVGFGNFGQFLGKEIVKQGHTVLAYSRSDYSRAAHNIGVKFFSDADDLCEEHPQVILLCTSILSTERVLRSLPLHRLRRSTLMVDVLSVKEFPRSLFLQLLPPDFDILCTHPMFGPDSGKAGWGGLPFVFEKVRVGSNPTRSCRVESFLGIFQEAGCRMVEMSCAEHDRHAAGSQFITHMMGRVLEKLALEDTPINTKGYESLLNLVDNTARDSFELFYGLFLYNKNAMEQLDRMHWAFETVKQQLSGYLHDLVRKQLMLESSSNDNNDFVGNYYDNNENDKSSDEKKLMLPAPGVAAAAQILPSSERQQNHDLLYINGRR